MSSESHCNAVAVGVEFAVTIDRSNPGLFEDFDATR